METGLETRFRKHLLDTVGKKPTKREMARLNRQIESEFGKIYDKPTRAFARRRDVFNKLSGIWNKVTANIESFSEVRIFRKYVKLEPDSNVASIASGNAVFELFMAREFFRTGKLYCIDISEEMSKNAKRFRARLHLNNVRIITASATNVPLKNNSQNLVLIRRSGLSNDKRWTDVLKEAHRIMKKDRDSRFIYTVDTEFSKPKAAIRSDLMAAKFKFIALKRFKNGDGKLVDMIIAKS